MLRIALKRVSLASGEDVGVRAEIKVYVRSQSGQFKGMKLIVDPGSSITSIGVGEARSLGLIIPERSLILSVNSASGKIRQARHPGTIHVQIPGFPGRVFIWPVHFVEHAGSPPKAALGLAGVLNDLRLIYDGTYQPDAPYGTLTLEPIRQRARPA